MWKIHHRLFKELQPDVTLAWLLEITLIISETISMFSIHPELCEHFIVGGYRTFTG